MTPQAKTYDELEKEITRIEMNPANTVGGHKAFFSGRQTELTAQAKAKIARLRKQQTKLTDDCIDD